VPGEFVRVCGVEEIEEGGKKRFRVESPDPDRLLVRTGGELFALTGLCPHERADLGEGFVDRGVLWCPIHSSGFDCRTGAVTHPPAEQPLETYRVETRDGSVYVSVRPSR